MACLNVWTPAATAKERLPVMVWIYGGGFVAGGSSEPRQDGGNLAKTGNPNGPGLPRWPEYDAKSGWQVMHLSASPQAAPDTRRSRYLFLDEVNRGKPAGQ